MSLGCGHQRLCTRSASREAPGTRCGQRGRLGSLRVLRVELWSSRKGMCNAEPSRARVVGLQSPPLIQVSLNVL